MIVFIIIYIVIITALAWILIRNNNTYKFMDSINKMCYDAISRALDRGILDLDEYYKIWDKLSYYDVLFSFKQLKLEYWFTKEEIELLNKYK